MEGLRPRRLSPGRTNERGEGLWYSSQNAPLRMHPSVSVGGILMARGFQFSQGWATLRDAEHTEGGKVHPRTSSNQFHTLPREGKMQKMQPFTHPRRP